MGSGGNETGGVESIPVGATVLVRSADGFDPLAFAGGWRSTWPTLLGVAVDRSIQSFLAEWRANPGTTPADVGVVGVGETMRSAAERTGGPASTGDAIRTVGDPTDLDTVAAHVRALLDGWRDRTEPTVVVVDSVAGLLDIAGEHEAAAFVANLSDLVAGADAIGFLAVQDPTDRTLDAVVSECDNVVEATADGWRPVEPVTRHEPLPADEVFTLLADRRRRQVLRFFDDRDRATIEDLVDSFAVEIDSDEWGKLAASLAHIHLPKLAGAGVVDYHARTGTVVATPAIEQLLSVLNLASVQDEE